MIIMKSLITVCVAGVCMLLLPSFYGKTARHVALSYIEKYKDVAISEMQRTGIPASIKLAQGMLESDLGRSPLAMTANNHFGIKCNKDWQGGTFYKHDDDVDAEGKLIESCFRKFDSAEESYRAHSDFLMLPPRQKRYASLFTMHPSDYKGWAHGLKAAGYATDPAYPAKLIRIIEEYNLFSFDPPTPEKPAVAPADMGAPAGERSKKESIQAATPVSNAYKYLVILTNNLKTVHAAGGETLVQIAHSTNTDVYDLLEWNEGFDTADALLETDQIIYLERKKSSFADPDVKVHIASGRESLFQISQRYGLRLQCLVDRNGIPEHAVPLEGEEIRLLAGSDKKPRPAYIVR